MVLTLLVGSSEPADRRVKILGTFRFYVFVTLVRCEKKAVHLILQFYTVEGVMEFI